MGYIIYNADGSIASQQSGGGGGASAGGKANSPQWIFWTDGSTNAATMPTSYSNMTNPIIRWNGNAYGTMGAGILMKTPGYISNLVGFVNGGTSGYNVQFAAFKNGNIMVAGGVNLETPGQSSTSAPFYPSKSGGAGYTFAANDLLSVYIKGDNNTINQSFSANLEWVLTA